MRNLQKLNKIIAYHHFEMESLQTSIQMITKGCNMDSKDVYYYIPTEENYQKSFNGAISFTNKQNVP